MATACAGLPLQDARVSLAGRSMGMVVSSVRMGAVLGTVLREFDLASREFVPDGFYLPEAKSGIDWLDRDTLLLSSPLGQGMATHSGFARAVRLWPRGTDPLASPIIFEAREGSICVGAAVDREASAERVWCRS